MPLDIVLVSTLLLVCAVSADLLEDKQQFANFIKTYNKQYVSEEEYNERFTNFRNNKIRIAELGKTNPKTKFGINKFADISPEEFQKTRTGGTKYSGKDLARSCLANGITVPVMDSLDIPTSFDWRNENKVTPVKDQGGCGSCWAFSTIGNIESQYLLSIVECLRNRWAIKGNNLTQFSEQLVVDCSTACSKVLNWTVCNEGCDGGWMWSAMYDIISWGGVELESEYPYVGYNETCKKSGPMIAPIKNYTCLSGPDSADEDQMAAYLVANGPLSIALDAELLQFYYSGIVDPYFEWECSPESLDHAVLIVGYGNDTDIFGTTPYWNSWGSDWGEEGYFRIYRGANTCGLANAVTCAIM